MAYSLLAKRSLQPRRIAPLVRSLSSRTGPEAPSTPSPAPSSSSSSAPIPPRTAQRPINKYAYRAPENPPESWLALYLRRSPTAMSIFKFVTGGLGMGTHRQVAGRVTYYYYDEECAEREAKESKVWHDECRLPRTFQTWFTVTNLHVWLLSVRLRALPHPHGRHYVQGLLDHFFLDVEDRLRQDLPKRVSERFVTGQMKILREQWAGLGLAFDYALGLGSPYLLSSQSPTIVPSVGESDAELAAAIWRNLLGARGAQGIDSPPPGRVRRAVNVHGSIGAPKLPSSEPEAEEKLRQLEGTDDLSGVYDFAGEETRLYVGYPELMWKLVRYVRRELQRLERIPDEQILKGGGVGKFGRVLENDPRHY